MPNFAPPLESILTNTPTFVGDPILAVAAVDETTAAEALEKIKIDIEALPFTIDPLQSLYPGGPDAHEAGNVVTAGSGDGSRGAPQLKRVKWTARDFAAVKEGQLPTGENLMGWNYGDLDQNFAAAKLVLDETFVTASNPHQSMEPRSAFSYWQNGKCFLHGSSQSQSFIVPGLATFLGIPPDQLVYIAEFCGGGFGSKGSAYAVMSIPAHMSKKINRPCMLRITRAEEYYLGSARAGFQGRMKLGFRADGKLIAADLYVVQQNGSKAGFWDSSLRRRGAVADLLGAGDALPRHPGVDQHAALRTAARPGPEPVRLRHGADPRQGGAATRYRSPEDPRSQRARQQRPRRRHGRRCRVPICPRHCGWARSSSAGTRRRKLSGHRKGSKVIGVGVGQGYHSAGFSGFDGLVCITPDGKLHIHSGVGNLGTYSYATTSRVAAEVLGCAWDDCIIERGDSSRHLPWNLGQFGSNTSFTMSRTNYAAAMDAKRKLQEIAAKDLGGAPEDYDVGGGRGVPQERPWQEAQLRHGGAARDRARRQVQRQGSAERHLLPHQDGGCGPRRHRPGRCGQGQPQAGRPRGGTGRLVRA